MMITNRNKNTHERHDIFGRVVPQAHGWRIWCTSTPGNGVGIFIDDDNNGYKREQLLNR
ncbi:hypothetical protein LguiB_024752 [Lonicera macranthoides]